MKTLYGTLIFFFYFVKYPLAIGLPLMYWQLNYENNWILNILWIVALMLILKDIFFPHEKGACQPKNK